MKYIAVAALCLLMTGCKELISDPLKVVYAANLVADCPDVQKLPDGATKNSLVDAYIDLKADYRDCASKHHKLASLLTAPAR